MITDLEAKMSTIRKSFSKEFKAKVALESYKAQKTINELSKGRALDNIFIERFWKSLKYEDIYLNDYQSVPELID